MSKKNCFKHGKRDILEGISKRLEQYVLKKKIKRKNFLFITLE